ncbi:unnamed protein product [Alopecurus aequalis]
MEAAGAGELGIVLFPWLAFGHMIPYLELSKRLAARGHAIAFVSTPRNIARLPPVPPGLSGRLRSVPLPLPTVDGLPEGAESTADLPPGNDELLKKAMDGLAVPFADFLSRACSDGGTKPDWIVHDFCHHWLRPIADKHKVPCAVFKIVLPSLSAFIGSRRANATNPRVALEDFTVAPKCCHEIEPGMFALLTDLFQKPSIPAGLLLLSHDVVHDNVVRSDVLLWLDNQPPKSVIYVARGSEAPLTTENLHELALGLELSGVRFLWALMKPVGMFKPDTDAGGANELCMLINGFEERTQGRGMVLTGWVRHVEALAHGAVSAFMTHCGWGSTIESFAFGLPLVMLPFTVDQPLVARVMTEKGIGVEVERDEADGSFYRDGVAKAVQSVMVEDERKIFTRNAKKLQKVLAREGRQEQYIDDLVEHLKRYKNA